LDDLEGLIDHEYLVVIGKGEESRRALREELRASGGVNLDDVF
jgi:hypothetical protein